VNEAHVIPFAAEGGTDLNLVGGKGASLGSLTCAGFPVPAGFTVSTSAYRAFLSANQLDSALKDSLAKIDYADADSVEAITADIRSAFEAATVPAEIADSIVNGYHALGSNPHVAVRSSGTAEDLVDASFAGQHDTYLDIRGDAGLLDAVARCWASLWTARATSYRQVKGFDHLEVSIAVVVQTMVESEVSGVLFTGNPLNAATDEMVINSAWGLGEAIVSGHTQPDEYTVRWRDLSVRQKHLGAKEIKIARDSAAGYGTSTVEVPAADQSRYSLTDTQLTELAALGRRVTEHYDSLPQDIEFGFANGNLYLLQSRPITGVAFSWDAELETESWQRYPERADAVWTRSMSDEAWTGACTPLMYSIRGYLWAKGDWDGLKLMGLNEALGYQNWKYYKGTAYYDTKTWEVIVARCFPKQFRAAMTQNLDPRRRDEVANSAFSAASLAKILAQVHALDRDNQGIWKTFKSWNDVIYTDKGKLAYGKSAAELQALSDKELIRFAEKCVEYEASYPVTYWAVIWVYVPWAIHLLGYMAEHWYTGANQSLVIDLLTGTTQRTATIKENIELWELSREIRHSPALRAAFEQSDAAAVLASMDSSDEGQAWRERYEEFRQRHGHRGHADRDIYFPRRSEDPTADIAALRTFLTVDDEHDPEHAEHASNARREAAAAEAIANIRQGTLGSVKVEAFKIVFDWISRFWVLRDDERYWLDRSTMSIKRCYLELNRRLMERGLLDTERDFYFLGREELYAVFEGRANMKLTRAKIAARAKNFDQVDAKLVPTAEFIQNYAPVDRSMQDEVLESGQFRGLPTSNGKVTARARIVRDLKDIGIVRPGEILVCNATDPGWTPVFFVIKGVVVETGGILAHAACLAREYGFPAVQLPAALQKIPDGALITVDGMTGMVTIEAEPDDDVAAA
jgi:pyruvate,water dikinase